MPASHLATDVSDSLDPELRSALEASSDAVLVVDRSGRIVALNRRVEALFGAPAKRLYGRPVEVLLPERARRAHAAERAAYAAAPTARPMSLRSGLTGLRADGTEFPVEVSLTPIVDSIEGLVMAVVHDVTARLPVEAAIATPDRTAGALDAIPDAILTTDRRGNLEFLNRAAEELTGWVRAAARGRALDEVLPLISEATGERLPSVVAECLRAEAIGDTFEAVVPARSGREARSVDLSTTPIRDSRGTVTGAAVVARDVTHARLIARQLAHQATHDPLTGLVNRREFERRLAHALASATGGRAQHAVCYLDLDGFKRVNDTCGHLAGDDLLRQLSELMRERMRSRDTLARLGGDEFGLLLEHCRRPQAERIADGIRKAIGDLRFIVEGGTYSVGASIGIVPIRGGMRPAEVLRQADAACYTAKRAGGDRLHVSDASPPEPPPDQEWSRRVVRTVEEHRFQLYAQPVVSLNRSAGRAPRLELLLRLEEAPGSPVLPRSFLPAVRRYGLTPKVDEWVIREAVRHLNEWGRAHAGKNHPTVAVNLSDETVASGRALSLVEGALAGTEVPAEALCFEISEATVAAHPTASAELVRRLRLAGCRTTLDHCGTGMTAFTQLRRLRPDFLKIAGHIIRGLDRDPVQRALARALNEVGHLLGLRTIGCQVESGCVLEHLRHIGVDFAQGFGLGRPEPLADAVAKLG